ncbi:MAG: TRAP transporter large permease [Thalassobaculum sp.]
MTDLLIDLLPLFMFLTLMGLVFTSYPIGFALGGTAILFGFIGMGLDVFSFREFFVFVPRVWSIAENLQIIAVPLFVFMGVMLERSRIAQDLLEALQMLLRPVPGGMALAVTLMGVIFAAITGVVGASVIMLTLIALPTMLQAGYRPSLALGTIAASSTLGILIPPSILIVFLSEMMQISFGYLFAAVIWPGLLLSGLYLLYIAGYAFLVKGAAPRLPPPPKDRDPLVFWGVLARGIVPPAILIFLVMGSVLSGLATITESAAVGAGGALLLAWLRGNLGREKLRESLHRSAMTVGMIFVLFIGATSFAFVFRILGGDEVINLLIDAADLDAWGILIMVVALIFLMGFFFDVLEIMLIAIPIFGPIVAPLDFGPHIAQGDVLYWFAVLVAITLQTSFLTPPMGLSLFYIKGVAPASVTMRQIYVGIVPFVILQMLCVAIVMAEPGLVTALPRWLFVQ